MTEAIIRNATDPLAALSDPLILAAETKVEDGAPEDIGIPNPNSPYFGHKVTYELGEPNDPDDLCEYDLSEFPEAYIDYLVHTRCGSIEATIQELEEFYASPSNVPDRIIDLTMGPYLFRGAAGSTVNEDGVRFERLGFMNDGVVQIETYRNDASWVDTSSRKSADDWKRVTWCLNNCKGDWLLSMGDQPTHRDDYPLDVMFFHEPDAEAFWDEFKA